MSKIYGSALAGGTLTDLRQGAADVAKHRVDCGCNVADAGDANESNQGNQQRVLDQVLALLAVLQTLELRIQVQI